MELSGLATFAGIFVAILVILAGIAYHFMCEQEDVVPDLTTGSTATSNSKKSKKNQQQQQQQRDSSAKIKQQKTVPKSESKKSNSDKPEPEEEPIVIIPDPFTRQINSRYASVMGANTGSSQQQSVKKEPNNAERKHASNLAVSNAAQKQKDEHQASQVASVNYNNSDFITVNPVVSTNQASVATTNIVSNNKINFDKANADAAKVRPKATVKPNQAIKENAYTTANGSIDKVINNLHTTSKPASMISQTSVLAKSMPEKDLTKLIKTVSSTLGTKVINKELFSFVNTFLTVSYIFEFRAQLMNKFFRLPTWLLCHQTKLTS